MGSHAARFAVKSTPEETVRKCPFCEALTTDGRGTGVDFLVYLVPRPPSTRPRETRDRERVMGGLKRTDIPILRGYRLFHNYIRPQDALKGGTPAEHAGIRITGEDRRRALIQNAKNASRSKE